MYIIPKIISKRRKKYLFYFYVKYDLCHFTRLLEFCDEKHKPKSTYPEN